MLELVQVKVDTKCEMAGDAPRTFSRSFLLAIICVIMLATTVIVLAIKLNSKPM